MICLFLAVSSVYSQMILATTGWVESGNRGYFRCRTFVFVLFVDYSGGFEGVYVPSLHFL